MILKQRINPIRDYLQVDLYLTKKQRLRRKKPRQHKTFTIHILVARTFLGPRPKGHVVHRRDHNRHNAWLKNLSYITSEENYRLRLGENADPLYLEYLDAVPWDEFRDDTPSFEDWKVSRLDPELEAVPF